MTAKRFELIEVNGNIEDSCTQIVYDGGEDVFELLDLLNSLDDENEQLKQLLDYADDLIQSHLSEYFIRQWRNFKTGHKEYNDFWEEKIKKHNELKEDV